MFSIWCYEFARENLNFLFKNILSILPEITSCWVQDINYCRHVINSFYEKNSIFKFILTAHIICIFDELPRHHFSFKHFTISFVYSSFSNYTATERIFLETKRKLKYRTPNLTIKSLKINLMSFRDFNGFVSPNRLN
jgi:hypothetical protein